MAILSRDDIERIHARSLDVLASVGVKVNDERVVRALREAGAKAGGPEGVMRIPGDMVTRALGSCPRAVRLCDPQGGRVDLTAGGPTVFWTGNAMHFVEGRQRRELTSQDFVKLCHVVDQLDQVHAIVGPSVVDYPPQTRDFVGFRIMAEHTRGKHLRPCIYTPKGAEAIYEMAQVLLDGVPFEERPIFSLGYTAVSPLSWSSGALDLFVRTSRKRIPLMINSEPASGATAPVTLAGALVTANAEALSGVVIAQTLEPGRPLVFNIGFAHALDMKFCIALTGSPENALLHAAGAEIARFHGLPSASWMSTEAKMADSQSAHEKTLTGLMDAFHGVNIIWGVGNLEGTLSMSLEQAVIDNEMVRLMRRVCQGIEVSEETMAVEAIKSVGLKSGFLDHEHTFAHYRHEQCFPELFSRSPHEVWTQRGGLSLEEAAARRVAELLDRPHVTALRDDQLRELDALVAKWRAEVGA